jgi:hypothetical protein
MSSACHGSGIEGISLLYLGWEKISPPLLFRKRITAIFGSAAFIAREPDLKQHSYFIALCRPFRVECLSIIGSDVESSKEAIVNQFAERPTRHQPTAWIIFQVI